MSSTAAYKVLVVDDEPALARALAINLRAQGWEVVTAPDGRSALEAAASTHPDVVLLDLGLPDMSIENDRFMLCGSPDMLADVKALLDSRHYTEGNHGEQGHYVIEKAFVDK